MFFFWSSNPNCIWTLGRNYPFNSIFFFAIFTYKWANAEKRPFLFANLFSNLETNLTIEQYWMLIMTKSFSVLDYFGSNTAAHHFLSAQDNLPVIDAIKSTDGTHVDWSSIICSHFWFSFSLRHPLFQTIITKNIYSYSLFCLCTVTCHYWNLLIVWCRYLCLLLFSSTWFRIIVNLNITFNIPIFLHHFVHF